MCLSHKQGCQQTSLRWATALTRPASGPYCPLGKPATGVQSELLIGGMGWLGLVLQGPTISVASWIAQESLALSRAGQGPLFG